MKTINRCDMARVTIDWFRSFRNLANFPPRRVILESTFYGLTSLIFNVEVASPYNENTRFDITSAPDVFRANNFQLLSLAGLACKHRRFRLMLHRKSVCFLAADNKSEVGLTKNTDVYLDFLPLERRMGLDQKFHIDDVFLLKSVSYLLISYYLRAKIRDEHHARDPPPPPEASSRQFSLLWARLRTLLTKYKGILRQIRTTWNVYLSKGYWIQKENWPRIFAR